MYAVYALNSFAAQRLVYNIDKCFIHCILYLQCFNAVGSVTERASGL